MGHSSSVRTWDEASSPAATGLVRRFEDDWRRRGPADRPRPLDYLPADPPPGARLALLRAELGLLWEAGEDVSADWYRRRYPDLGAETLVALVYEEFCLREEDRQDPDPAEFLGRFPEIAPALRRVFDIHGLVGHGQSTAFYASGAAPRVALPEAGQTIAGFHLVEELGRGTFARVFRAEERQLADRPVALKVARAGSREPQTLARLQHTHIVPVHSYRIDPATDLHLLCMPYFGRVTLAQLLADDDVKVARSGAELVEALDRLDPEGPSASCRPMARRELASRTYARAVAWWGARLAEALQHAHERGILHRDIKPSNVLVTADGMPMLLDFNLAHTAREAVDEMEAVPGGTVAYMAPEHLEALADGIPGKVDGRSDLYALGVVLYEAMGTRPFALPSGSRSVSEALLRAAEQRRRGAPRLREDHPEVPTDFEAVVRRCLAPEPADRYANAADLAIDLQAVADDAPLRFAREPLPGRAVRWTRRHRRRLAVAAPLALATAAVGYAWFAAQVGRLQLKNEADRALFEGRLAEDEGRLGQAIDFYEMAARLARDDPALDDLALRARHRQIEVEKRDQVVRKADHLLGLAEPLRFALLGFGGDPRRDGPELLEALRPFYVLENRDWTARAELQLLDRATRSRLITEVNELLFFYGWAAASDRSADASMIRTAIQICAKAPDIDRPAGPWQALGELCRARLERRSPRPLGLPPTEAGMSAWTCFRWGLLAGLDDPGRPERAIAWLDRAVRRRPEHYWYQYYLAYYLDGAGRGDLAQGHYNAAVALRPGSPWARYSRALYYRDRQAWNRAREDLVAALGLAEAQGFDLAEARNELGTVLQRLGDFRGAHEAYERVIAAAGPEGRLGRIARLNRATLDAEAGADARAREGFDRLLAEDPGDRPSRLGRALLAARLGRLADAEADLSRLAESGPADPEVLARRAEVRLALGHPAEALADAEGAARLASRPALERLRTRALLAAGGPGLAAWRPERPEDLDDLPFGGPALRADLRRAAEALRSPADGPARLARAVVLAALGDPEAEAEATAVVEVVPDSARARLIRARVRRRLGDRRGARADLATALALEHDDPRLWECRGRLGLDAGASAAALADLDRAADLGTATAVAGPRAETLMSLGRPREALVAWSRLLEHDPDDPAAYLGRARALIRLGLTDQALADLEAAVGAAGPRGGLLGRIALAYASCLPRHPDRLPRVLGLARRALAAALGPEPRPGPPGPSPVGVAARP